MTRIYALISALILSLGLHVLGQGEVGKVNLVLIMDNGKIGKAYFDDFVEQEETERNETKQEALSRITRELTYKLREGLSEKAKRYRYGDFPNAQYTLTVHFIKSNKDGQNASFSFELKNNQTGAVIATFTKSDGGGSFGSRVNLLGDCLIGVGKKAAKEIEKLI